MPSPLDMLFHNMRASLGLPSYVPPTDEEKGETARAEAARIEGLRLEREAFLAAAPRYALGDGGFARSERLMGRCANGNEADRGRVFHVVAEGPDGKALCGVKEGTRSVGWTGPSEEPASCPKCLARLTKLGGTQC
ncbi:hypothetical protein [Methylobacterium sp. J-090]|uniref:hypothetical protein n=1 Tax=Methylobacterium sp. J-090 TaxID=2836666 RepID=UPI001FB93B27|nr:hypothetical protein [Methylobacterium sp. J-090]MCJ2081551.1 hypothetical protein [Methylobacterium sp. J-090]